MIDRLLFLVCHRCCSHCTARTWSSPWRKLQSRLPTKQWTLPSPALRRRPITTSSSPPNMHCHHTNSTCKTPLLAVILTVSLWNSEVPSLIHINEISISLIYKFPHIYLIFLCSVCIQPRKFAGFSGCEWQENVGSAMVLFSRGGNTTSEHITQQILIFFWFCDKINWTES